MALEPFRVPVPGWEGASGGFFYLPEFLSFSESDSVLKKPHNDGPTYFPAVATLSLGGHVLLDIYPWREAREAYPTTPLFSILQEPRSLLIIQGDAYRNYLHGIAERTQDDAPRMANVANSAQLSAPLNDLVDAARRGENVLCSRERRVSLTFRDVERVQRGLRIGR